MGSINIFVIYLYISIIYYGPGGYNSFKSFFPLRQHRGDDHRAGIFLLFFFSNANHGEIRLVFFLFWLSHQLDCGEESLGQMTSSRPAQYRNKNSSFQLSSSSRKLKPKIFFKQIYEEQILLVGLFSQPGTTYHQHSFFSFEFLTKGDIQQ